MPYEALLELSALEKIDERPIAEAHYDCQHRAYQLTFTPFEQMHEGLPYRRWIFACTTTDARSSWATCARPTRERLRDAAGQRDPYAATPGRYERRGPPLSA